MSAEPSSTPVARAIGVAALVGLFAAGLVLAAGAAGHALFFFVPAGRSHAASWLTQPLDALGVWISPFDFGLLLAAMSVCYLAALWAARSLPARMVIGAVVALNAVFLLAPTLFSADVFGYINYARLGTLHGLNPYTHGADAATFDASFTYVRWHDLATPYGPLFTLLTYALVPLGVHGELWALKLIAAAASLGCVALTWRIAALRGLSSKRAALFVGLNPLLLVYGVAGAHNDLLLMLVVLTGVWLLERERPAGGGATLSAAAAIKASMGLVVPFALIGLRGSGQARRATAGATAGAVASIAVGVAVFGPQLGGFLGVLGRQQHLVATYSVPNQLAVLFGAHGASSGLRFVFIVALVVVVAGSLAWTRRGADWICAAGWATLALLVATAWFSPWYVIWLLPLAALARRGTALQNATLVFCAYVVITRIAFLYV